MTWIGPVLSLLLSVVLNKLFVRLFRHASVEKKYNPQDVRWSTSGVPVVGGISFLMAFLLSGIAVGYEGMQMPMGFLMGGILAYGVGILDDTYVSTPMTKFLGQILAATVAIFLTGPLFLTGISLVDIGFTLFWYVAVMNAFNMMDNMDAVSSVVGLGILGGIAFFLAGTELFLSTLMLIGALIGFLVVNWPPARLYMGDNGSQFIGFCLAYFLHAFWHQQVDREGVGYVLGIMLGLFALLASDTFWVIISRILRKKSPFAGNTDHLSHGLVRLGVPSYRVPLLLGIIQIGLSGGIIFTQSLVFSWFLAIVVFVGVGAIHLRVLYPTLTKVHA